MGSIAVVCSAGPGALERALRAAPHRGHEVETHVEGDIGLGISTGGVLDDAWLARRNGGAAVLAGTIDNRAEVEAELGVTADDPAGTLLAAFAAWGTGAPARLRGVFSGAWTD